MYVVIDSIQRRDLRPFGGCYKVQRMTESTIWFERPRKDEVEIVRVPRSRVLFFTDKDMNDELEVYNSLVRESSVKHNDLVKRLMKRALESRVYPPKRTE